MAATKVPIVRGDIRRMPPCRHKVLVGKKPNKVLRSHDLIYSRCSCVWCVPIFRGRKIIRRECHMCRSTVPQRKAHV